MLYSALGFFALAVVGGLYLLSFVLSNKQTPKVVVAIHGLFALTGIVLLILYPFFYKPAPITSLVLFILAALGGVMMVFRDVTGKGFPKWMALGHGATAIIALILLAVFAVSS